MVAHVIAVAVAVAATVTVTVTVSVAVSPGRVTVSADLRGGYDRGSHNEPPAD
jgi:hypothetical protein